MPEQEQSVTLLHATAMFLLVECLALPTPSPTRTSPFRKVVGCLLSGNCGWVLGALVVGGDAKLSGIWILLSFQVITQVCKCY